MSMEASGGGASVGSSDRSGGNNVCDECSIGMDQIIEESNDQNEEFSEQENKQLYQNEKFSEGEMDLFISFEKALQRVNKTGRPKIQKVPFMLRKNDKFKKYFEPNVFIFGPYNRPSRTHKIAKQIKVNLAAKFLEENRVEKKYLYAEIRKHIKEIKDYYDDDSTKDYIDKDHKLVWMFLEDGCAILQFMYIFVYFMEDLDYQFRTLGINIDYAEFLAHDLFLLENQLPYQLLRLIIRHATKHQKTKEDRLLKSIYEFIFQYYRKPEEWDKNKDNILKDYHVHLLDLWRKMLIQPLLQKAEKRDLREIINDWTVSLFEKLKCNRNESDRDWFPVPHRNIGKLREAGINLKPTKTSSVRDFSFSGGTLKLPRIILDESTTTMFFNMLGYEMCPDFQNKSEVSTYLYFLDKLIDRTQDVEELREKNILLHDLGSDEEVVKLFNEISIYLLPNSELYKVKRDIENYFEIKGLILLHEVCHAIHQYFKGRWSLLAFIGALIAVVSSIIQTIITVLGYQADSKKGN